MSSSRSEHHVGASPFDIRVVVSAVLAAREFDDAVVCAARGRCLLRRGQRRRGYRYVVRWHGRSATIAYSHCYRDQTLDVSDGLRIPHWSWDGLLQGVGLGAC